MQKERKKRIVLVMPYYGSLAIFPAVIQAVKRLNHKYDISIVTSNSVDVAEESLFAQVYRLKFFGIRNILTLPINSLYFSYHILKLHPDIMVCFTADGIEAAFFSIILGMGKKVKYIYYNLEILTDDQYQSRLARVVYSLRKRIERWYAKKSCAFIIQDSIRYQVSKNYGIEHPNVYFLPNTYVSRGQVLSETREYKKILYIGALSEWSIGDLMDNMEAFRGMDITFSGWDNGGFLKKYAEELKKYLNIHVIEQQLNDVELDKFIEKYDIGLVYYSSLDDNIRNIGLSSGKFFKFLSMGKPVIVRNLPGMAEIVNSYDLGIVVNGVDDFYEAYQRIKLHDRDWNQKIAKIYEEKFDYYKLLDDVVERIEKSNG